MKRVCCVGLVIAIALCGVTACSGRESADMVLCVGGYPDTIDPALNSAADSATYIVHVFCGLAGWEQNEAGARVLVPQCAKALPEAVPAADGKVTYTYELRDDLVWSDGTPLTAADFVYAWNRAAAPSTGADYSYLFEAVDGYDRMVATDETGKLQNPDAVLNVTASEDGKRLTVTLPVDVPYFHELTAFPVFMPVRQDLVERYGDAWAVQGDTYIGNGAYRVVEFTNSRLVLEKNPRYFDADRVVSGRLEFAFNSDDVSQLTNFQNGSYQFIDAIPNEEIAALQQDEAFHAAAQLGTYYVSFNVNDTALQGFSQEESTKIRKAMSLLVDRNYICSDIGQAGQVPASGFVPLGLTEPDGTAYVDRNGPNRDGAGYFRIAAEDYAANCTQAVRLLTEVAESSGRFTVIDGVATGFPNLTYLTNEGSGHVAVANYLQQVWGQYGIPIKVEVQEWGTFLNTRKNGDYSVARNGWLADYNDPITFLDMWTTASGNNDSQLGHGAHREYAGYGGQTWSQRYDELLRRIKTTTDPDQRFELMHQAEDLLMETGAVCPLYYYTDVFLCTPRVKGFFASPLGVKYFMYASYEE